MEQLFCLDGVESSDFIKERGKGNRKLNEYKVKMIRAERAAGRSYVSLGKKYKVAPNTIKAAVERRTWKYVHD